MVDRKAPEERSDEGFMLLAVIVLVFLVLLALTVAAPKIAMQLKREREVEAKHRADQYVRAIRVYYRKFKTYPTSVDALVKSNNQRFLRQKYVDPLTGKDDWRLIHVGENKTKVKGFFGEDLPGIGGTGLGSSIGGAGTTGGTTGGTSGGTSSAFNNSGLTGGAGSGTGIGGTGTSGGAGTTGGSGTSGGTGVQSQDATTFTGTGGGPIMGIGSSKSGDAILVVNEQTTYDTWEFLYDPRIEQLYAKASLIGGINSGSGTSGGLGTPIGGTTPTPGSTTPPNPQQNPPNQ